MVTKNFYSAVAIAKLRSFSLAMRASSQTDKIVIQSKGFVKIFFEGNEK